MSGPAAGTGLDLSEVMAKLAWARVHIQRLHAETAAFQKRDPRSWTHRVEIEDPSAPATRYFVRAVLRESPPIEWALITGDALHNLRCALDYLVWAITPPDARTSRTSFPIFTTESAFRANDRAMSTVAGVVEEHRAFVERMQPYRWGEKARSHPLLALQQMSNIEKHRALIPVITTVDLPYVGTTNARLTFEYVESGPLSDGAEIYRFVARRQDDTAPMQVHPHATFQVALEGDPHGRSAESVLGYVQSHILGAVDAYFNHGVLPE